MASTSASPTRTDVPHVHALLAAGEAAYNDAAIRGLCAEGCLEAAFGAVRTSVEESATTGVGDRLEPVVRAQLAIDVMQVVAQRLR